MNATQSIIPQELYILRLILNYINFLFVNKQVVFKNLNCWFNGVLTQSNWPYINVYNIIKLIQLCSEDFAMMELGLLILLFIIILTLGTRTVRIPKISAYTKSPATRDHLLSCQSGVHRSGFYCLGSYCSGWTDPTRDRKAATSTTGPNSTPAPPDVGRRTSNSRPCYKVHLSRLCWQQHQSRSEISVQQMFWMGARKMFRTLKCSSVSEK